MLIAVASQVCWWREPRLRTETWLAKEDRQPLGGLEEQDEDSASLA